MIEKQKIAIDSCVFFHMLKYNDIFEKKGLAEVIIEAKNDQKKYIEARENLDKFMTTILKEKEKKNGKPFTFDKKLSLCGSVMSNKSKEFPQEIKDVYKKLQAEYAKAKTYAFVGELYHRHKVGLCDFYLTPTSIDEIKYHRDLPKEKKHAEENEEYFAPEQINSFARNCCLGLKFSPDMQKETTVVSEILRGKIELPGLKLPRPAMKNDNNKNGVFGDSLIMAECGVAGITFVTQNEKDFIYDKGTALDKNGVQNTARRDAIRQIFEKLGYSRDALPYSVEEFLNNTADSMINEKVMTGDDGMEM